MPALVVCIDGPDFSGKTTVANLLMEILREKNRGSQIIFKRTSIPSDFISGSFTKILRNSADKISSRVFALAYALDHLHHFETFIKPLRESKEFNVVIQERSLLTTYVYQGIVGDVDFSWLKEINKYCLNYPDLTLILKIDLNELIKRRELGGRDFDAFEVKSHLKKQTGAYYNLPQDLRKRFNVELIDADQEPISVARRCANRIQLEIDRMKLQ